MIIRKEHKPPIILIKRINNQTNLLNSRLILPLQLSKYIADKQRFAFSQPVISPQPDVKIPFNYCRVNNLKETKTITQNDKLKIKMVNRGFATKLTVEQISSLVCCEVMLILTAIPRPHFPAAGRNTQRQTDEGKKLCKHTAVRQSGLCGQNT